MQQGRRGWAEGCGEDKLGLSTTEVVALVARWRQRQWWEWGSTATKVEAPVEWPHDGGKYGKNIFYVLISMDKNFKINIYTL